MEWNRFSKYFGFLKYWPARGLFYVFVALITWDQVGASFARRAYRWFPLEDVDVDVSGQADILVFTRYSLAAQTNFWSCRHSDGTYNIGTISILIIFSTHRTRNVGAAFFTINSIQYKRYL